MQAMVFDLFETLITEWPTPPHGVSKLAPVLGCEEQRDAFRAAWKARSLAVRTGRLSFRDALRDIVTSLGGSPDEGTLQRVCEERIRAKAAPFDRIEPEIIAMLDALRTRDVRIAVISNACREDVTAWPASALASRVECALFSFEAGVAKPDPAIYLEATRRLRVDPSETVYIGDGQDDELAGAERAGLRAFKALWFASRWPHFREEDASSNVPRLRSIEQIADLWRR